MPEPKYQAARNWSRERRFAEAVKRVVDEDWTQADAAVQFGVSRPRLNEHVKAYKERQADLAERVLAQAVDPVGLNERRRVGTFEEFDEHYFGRWQCPDCETHHPTPEFHRDIDRALEGENSRVLINMPPYHAKSTRVTVKHTVYQLVRDPNHRTIIISKSLGFAKEFLHSIDQLLTNPDLYLGGPSLLEDWGPFKDDSKDSIWNTEKIYVAGRVTAEKDPTVKVIGVGGQIYGSRADTIKADDVATLENQRNPERVMQMLEWFDKEVSSRIGRRGKLIWVGTRVHPGDIYSTLGNREGYKVLRFPAILQEGTDEGPGLTLWPDHFTYEMACSKRTEMSDADFQLVYQNVDIPGLGASFTAEMLDECKDRERMRGHYDPSWRLIAGLDLAGGNAGSGYTAGTLEGIDLKTGKRFLVDIFNVKSMRAPQLKGQILDWSDMYPIYEWRVENNGLQSNLVQYNEEIITHLAKRGIRVTGHNTASNKWDPQFGVESLAPLYQAQMVSIPWGNSSTAQVFQQLINQLLTFPMGSLSDVVMSHWFADLGCRDLLRRAHLPMFNERMRVPERVARRRRVIDFASGEVRSIPLAEQRRAVYRGRGTRGYRRVMVGHPTPHRDFEEPAPEAPQRFVNVAGEVLAD
jgi:hypothetical protein